MGGTSINGRITPSQVKLLLFGLVTLVILALSVGSGWVQRDRIRELGGPLHVVVVNGGGSKARTDVYASDQYATLELEPGEQGLLRFSPRGETPVKLELYRRGEFQAAVQHGRYTAGQKVLVEFTLMPDGEIVIAEKPRTEGSS